MAIVIAPSVRNLLPFIAVLSLIGGIVAAESALAESSGGIVAHPVIDPPHPPQSGAEMAADALIHLDDSGYDLFFFMIKRPSRNRSLDRRFAPLFSKELQAAWAQEEKRLVLQGCNGRYIDGELCGIDFRPLVCAQDYSEEGYTYRTLRSDAKSALIEMSWAEHSDNPSAQYRMILVGDRWVMDGVYCLRWGVGFNWPKASPSPK